VITSSSHCSVRFVPTEDLVHGLVGRQGAIEDVELPLQSRRDVVPSAARMDHRREQHDILHGVEVARFVQRVEPFVLHQLTHDLVRDLIAPFVYLGHIYVVDEDAHFPAARWTERGAHSLLHIALEYALENGKRSGYLRAR